MQRIMADLRKLHTRLNKEQGRWILYNFLTGQILVTTQGINATGGYYTQFENPGLPSPWVVVGRVHTHSNRQKTPTDDDYNNTQGSCRSAIILMKKYRMYQQFPPLEPDGNPPRYLGPLKPIYPGSVLNPNIPPFEPLSP